MKRRTLVLLIALTLASATSAFAQADFSGQWAPLYQEDPTGWAPTPCTVR